MPENLIGVPSPSGVVGERSSVVTDPSHQNNHVIGEPPPVEAHGHKIVELEKTFVCVADRQFLFHDTCKAIDILRI